MTKRFKKVYNALLKGYFKGTLASGHCSACAVGNIVADANGGIIQGDDFNCTTNNWYWSDLFCGGIVYAETSHPDRIAIFKLTGYTIYELAQIELTFENTSRYLPKRLWSVQEINTSPMGAYRLNYNWKLSFPFRK